MTIAEARGLKVGDLVTHKNYGPDTVWRVTGAEIINEGSPHPYVIVAYHAGHRPSLQVGGWGAWVNLLDWADPYQGLTIGPDDLE